MKIVIVMATYNGGKFIEEQIRSIQLQTVENWTLLVRDDGSADDTVDIIRRMAKTESRIILLQDNYGNLGVVQNFSHLMQAATELNADYVAMADQDDFWKSEKLQILLDRVKSAESVGGAHAPVLVHSDLEVVDGGMCSIFPSFMGYFGISPDPLKFGHLLCQNDVTGCTCFINRALLRLALPVPQVALMHDWWIALLASCCGEVAYVDMPLVRYRQHVGNVVGAKSDLARAAGFLINPAKWKAQAESVRLSIRQASVLIERIRDRNIPIPDKKRLEVIEEYAKLPYVSRLERLKIIKKYAVHKRSVISDIFFKFVILSIPVSEQR